MTKGEITVLGKISYWLPGFIYQKDDQIDYDGKQYAVKVYQEIAAREEKAHCTMRERKNAPRLLF